MLHSHHGLAYRIEFHQEQDKSVRVSPLSHDNLPSTSCFSPHLDADAKGRRMVHGSMTTSVQRLLLPLVHPRPPDSIAAWLLTGGVWCAMQLFPSAVRFHDFLSGLAGDPEQSPAGDLSAILQPLMVQVRYSLCSNPEHRIVCHLTRCGCGFMGPLYSKYVLACTSLGRKYESENQAGHKKAFGAHSVASDEACFLRTWPEKLAVETAEIVGQWPVLSLTDDAKVKLASAQPAAKRE